MNAAFRIVGITGYAVAGWLTGIAIVVDTLSTAVYQIGEQ